jgi:hypothetical protein
MRTRGDEQRSVTQNGDLHAQLVNDVVLLQDSRVLLVERLERVLVALALTLDAEEAAELRLAELQARAGARRIGACQADELSSLAQRYRDVIRAVESANHDVGRVGSTLR